MTHAKESAMRRIAIVLASLPQPIAQRLLGSLQSDNQQMVRVALSSLEDVDPLERKRALDGFAKSLRSSSSRHQDANAPSDAAEIVFSRTALRSLPSRDPAPGRNVPHDSSASERSAKPLAFLMDVDDETLVTHLSGEMPQTLAIILASISPSQAARVLPRLDVRVRTEAMRRMARLQELPMELIEDIGTQLRSRLAPALQSNGNTTGAGRKALDAIMAEIPQPQTTQPAPHRDAPGDQPTAAPERIASTNPDSLRPLKIAEGTHHAEDAAPKPAVLRSNESIQQFLVTMPSQRLRDALAKVGGRESLLAICGLPKSTAAAVLALLPRKQARQVREQLASLGSLELRQIDQAKEAVARVALSQASVFLQPAVAA